MGEAVDIAGTEDKTAAELEWIFAQLVLFESAGLGALAGRGIVAAQDVQQVGFAQSGGAIGLAIGVNEQRKSDAGLFAEEAGVMGVAESDGGEGGAALAEARFEFAQLRDVLSAEDSTVVSQEDDHRRSCRPERAQLDGVSVGVRQDEWREFAAEAGGSHGGGYCRTFQGWARDSNASTRRTPRRHEGHDGAAVQELSP